MERDSIDFGKMHIPVLFMKILIPTLMGFLFTAIFNLADGIFVGQGVGSDALAAVNIAAPIFLISTATALMFGSGASIVAAIHLSKENNKAANINVTQAFGVALLLTVILMIAVLLFTPQVAYLFGSSEKLLPFVIDYLRWVSPCLVLVMIEIVGMFVIRLDGSPKFAMWVNIAASLLNIFLDWLFVFPLQMGIKGAAMASSISAFTGASLIIIYMSRFSKKLHFYHLKSTVTSLKLTVRNVGYMCKLGFSTFIGEIAISCMMIVGNYMFMRYLREDGVAAFSTACYTFPLVFMFGSAIAQTALPIISYNHGLGDGERVRKTLRLSVMLTLCCGTMMTLAGIFFRSPLIRMFLASDTAAFAIADAGFPYFATNFLFCSLNIILIGYYQSIEKAKPATIFMLLRGLVFVIPCFILLPIILNVTGLWIAITVSEVLTFCVILLYARKNKTYPQPLPKEAAIDSPEQ